MLLNTDEIGRHLEQFDYEYFLNQALEQAPTDIDTREGSIFYDAVAPACFIAANIIMDLKNVMLETFVLTATGGYLDLRAEESGISRIQATKSVVRAKVAGENGEPFIVPIGSRFSSIGDDPVYFVVTEEEIEPGSYQLTCETVGGRGNEYIGQLLPLDNFNGLDDAYLTEIVIPARDTESDDQLRNRMMTVKEQIAFGGNVQDYINWVSKQDGVLGLQVYPNWNGPGTVLLVVLNNENKLASIELIDRVQQAIDPTRDGEGIGQAPIGHVVTVKTAEERKVNVSFELSLESGITLIQVEEEIINAIEAYYAKLREDWSNRTLDGNYECQIVRAQIMSRVLAVQGVTNVQNLMLDGEEDDVSMILNNSRQQLPFLEEVVIL